MRQNTDSKHWCSNYFDPLLFLKIILIGGAVIWFLYLLPWQVVYAACWLMGCTIPLFWFRDSRVCRLGFRILFTMAISLLTNVCISSFCTFLYAVVCGIAEIKTMCAFPVVGVMRGTLFGLLLGMLCACIMLGATLWGEKRSRRQEEY